MRYKPFVNQNPPLMNYLRKTKVPVLFFALAAAMLTSCEETSNVKTNQPAVNDDAVSNTGTMKLNGEIISIPSPVQVITLLQKSNIPFDPSITNAVASKSRYVNETKKALNLGIFGADLAYVSNYNPGQTANDYLDAVAGVANDLGILEKIDKRLVAKLNSNIGNRDSLVKLSTEFFKLSDRYLRDNQQGHLSSYILIGGWIEGLHLAASASKSSEQLLLRLGEQKYSAPSIAKLATQLNDKAFEGVKQELTELCDLLSELSSTYKYEKPINDRDTKTTYLMSKTSVVINAEQLSSITEQVEKVRNLIIE